MYRRAIIGVGLLDSICEACYSADESIVVWGRNLKLQDIAKLPDVSNNFSTVMMESHSYYTLPGTAMAFDGNEVPESVKRSLQPRKFTDTTQIYSGYVCNAFSNATFNITGECAGVSKLFNVMEGRLVIHEVL